MVLYVVNTPVISISEEVEKVNIKVRRISIDKAREILKNANFISAVGHESTAQFMSQIFETEIPTNRVYIKYMPGDKSICLKILKRLPEGKVLSEEELKEIPFELYYLEFF